MGATKTSGSADWYLPSPRLRCLRPCSCQWWGLNFLAAFSMEWFHVMYMESSCYSVHLVVSCLKLELLEWSQLVSSLAHRSSISKTLLNEPFNFKLSRESRKWITVMHQTNSKVRTISPLCVRLALFCEGNMRIDVLMNCRSTDGYPNDRPSTGSN